MKKFILFILLSIFQITYCQTYINIGSTKKEVKKVQGEPTAIENFKELNTEIWNYDIASITFEHGKVSSFRNYDGTLKIGDNSKKEEDVKNLKKNGEKSINNSGDDLTSFIKGLHKQPQKPSKMSEGTFSYTGLAGRPGAETTPEKYEQQNNQSENSTGKSLKLFFIIAGILLLFLGIRIFANFNDSKKPLDEDNKVSSDGLRELHLKPEFENEEEQIVPENKIEMPEIISPPTSDQYFIALDNDKKGPFKIEDLKMMNLTDKYFVWYDGLDEWKPILSINELVNFVIKTPPPTQKELDIINQKIIFKDTLKNTFFWFLGILVGGFIIMGGFASEDYLASTYKYNNIYPIFAPRDELRGIVFKTSLVLSIIISLIILIYNYMKKIKN